MSLEYRGQRNPDVYLVRPENSTPAEIRKYLAALLVQNHDRSVEEGIEAASLWNYGRGSDFYQYDLETFKNIFGVELGMLFYLYSRGLTPGGRIMTFWDSEYLQFLSIILMRA